MVRLLLFASLVLGIFPAAGIGHASDRPNIVVILADDFGVGDIQAHFPEHPIPTPHLDRLVREGMSFTDAHSPSAVCSPTRYGLLTGRYCWRTRLQEWVVAAYEPPLIAPDRPTLPGYLGENGYHTACIGKWHLGWSWPGPQPSRMTEVKNGQKNLGWDFTQRIDDGPVDRGFDAFFGVDLPNLPPFTWIENDRVVVQPTEPYAIDPEEGIVLPKAFEGCPSAPGWSLQDVLPEITRRAVGHIREQAKRDEPFFLYFSQTSPHEPVTPSEAFRGRSGIAPIADFLMETDWSVGEVLKAIDEVGIAENTLVIFTADNGHSHYTGWDDLVAAGHHPSGPWRGHKGDIWEGGHRVPLVARWPGRIEPESTSDRLVSLTDLFATCAEIVGEPLPKTGAEDSLSFLPDLLGEGNADGRTSLVSHSNMGEFAWRDGPWKLVYRMAEAKLEPSRGKPTVAELYHLGDDPGETENLASRHPDRVARMEKEFAELVGRGATRTDRDSPGNDTDVDFRATQVRRWADPPQRPTADSKQR